VQIIWLAYQNAGKPTRISQEEADARLQHQSQYAQKLRELEHEYQSKKHLATGGTVFDRIFNAPDQTIDRLIKLIAQEALPTGWSCEVKVEEFTHFILLVYLPHNEDAPQIDQLTALLQPIVKYCDPYLSDIAVFDRRRKSYLFFDNSMLAQLKSDERLLPDVKQLATAQGSTFTRFNSITVKCENYNSHLYLPIEISGSNGIVTCLALLDTGASTTMLSYEIIAQTGRGNLDTATRRSFSTANGTINCPIVRREVNVGGLRKNIEIAVNQDDSISLLGMNYFEGMEYIIDFGKSAIYIWEK
jgi:predicted aspartyl protease